jgi:hypothetical protein
VKSTFYFFAALVLQALFLVSCDKINIPGMVAGQVMTEAGVGRGLMTIALIDAATGQEVQRTQSEDGGNYVLEKVPPGEYTIKVIAIGDQEYETDIEQFKLGPGKTLTKNIIIYGKKGEAGGEDGGGGMDNAAGGEGGY